MNQPQPETQLDPVNDPDFETVGKITVDDASMSCRNVDVFYGDKQAIFDVSIDVGRHEVLSMIGPSGCGKSTILRCLNRMNDTIDICRVSGEIKLEGEDIYGRDMDVVLLRARVGMVFQKPNPFPKSVYDNVAYGVNLHGLAANKSELDDIVEDSLEVQRESHHTGVLCSVVIQDRVTDLVDIEGVVRAFDPSFFDGDGAESDYY